MDLKNPLNPWSVEDVDVFLFYCCPQCDHRSKSKHSFIEHAFIEHPESKENVNCVKTEHFLKTEPFPDESLLVNIKEESEFIEHDLDYLFNDIEDEDLPLVKKQKKRKKIVKKEKEIIEDEDDDKEYQCYR